MDSLYDQAIRCVADVERKCQKIIQEREAAFARDMSIAEGLAKVEPSKPDVFAFRRLPAT